MSSTTIRAFPGVNGFDLAMQMQQGAERFGVVTKMETVESVELGKFDKAGTYCTGCL